MNACRFTFFCSEILRGSGGSAPGFLALPVRQTLMQMYFISR